MPDTLETLTLPALLALGSILAGSIAAGLNLYATIAALGIASLTGLTAPLPAGLSGLENGVVLGTALVLLAVDALADREPAFAGTWNLAHTPIKGAAAATICAAAVTRLDPLDEALLCAAVAILAGLVHAVRFGQRVMNRAPEPPTGSLRLTIAEAALAATLAVLALAWPRVASGAGVIALLALLALGASRWRAFRLALAVQRARLRRLVGGGGWIEPSRMPGWVRRTLPDMRMGTPPRGARAAALDTRGMGRFRPGWLVVAPGATRFLTRSLRGTRVIELDPASTTVVTDGSLGTVYSCDDTGRFLVLPDGPRSDRVMRSFQLALEDRRRTAPGGPSTAR